MLNNLLLAAGDNEALYLEPASAMAQSALEQLSAAEREALAIGQFAYREGEPVEVKVLRRGGAG